MSLTNERDFPVGHPASSDYNPKSPEAIEWRRKNVHPRGERDFPVDHPKAMDTKGNTNSLEWTPGIDPRNPELEEHTGRTPKQAEAVREINLELAQSARESLALVPCEAPAPPKSTISTPPHGQPSSSKHDDKHKKTKGQRSK